MTNLDFFGCFRFFNNISVIFIVELLAQLLQKIFPKKMNWTDFEISEKRKKRDKERSFVRYSLNSFMSHAQKKN